MTDAKVTSIPSQVEKVYFKCIQCGEIILFIDRYGGLEQGSPPPKDPELVANVLAGKVKLISRKCDKCFAASYTEYSGDNR
jgi:hypothetical protein